MLLESITLENFRQFRHESIDFAQGENGKNVTIIIGENGTGKTTFAQAFFWCMYGETEFSDKNMLNKLVAAKMKPGQESKVQVILKLRHGTVNYTLMREQTQMAIHPMSRSLNVKVKLRESSLKNCPDISSLTVRESRR